jgi:3D (Asp-Asp-Asp) domain-containing protein
MKNKIIVLLTVVSIGLSIGFGASLYQSNRATSQLNVVQAEATSLQDALNKSNKDLLKCKKDLKSKTSENKKLKSDLEVAKKTVEELKDSEYELIYLGEFKLTHYCDERYDHICGGNGVTASGTATSVGRTVAVDPSVIPYGTTIYIEGYGYRVAEDCGGAVNNNQIDILVSTHDEANCMGTTSGGVWVLL